MRIYQYQFLSYIHAKKWTSNLWVIYNLLRYSIWDCLKKHKVLIRKRLYSAHCDFATFTSRESIVENVTSVSLMLRPIIDTREMNRQDLG